MTSLAGMKQSMLGHHNVETVPAVVIEAKKGLLEIRRGKVKDNISGRERVERERYRYFPGSPSGVSENVTRKGPGP